MIQRWNDLESFLADTAQHPRNANGAWYGHHTHAQALDFAHHGDDSLVDDATKLLDQLHVEVDFRAYQWQPSPCGAFPSVPEYLSSSPTCMRVRRKMVQELAPVNIYVSTTISASISTEMIATRGTAILALLMELERTRPVQVSVLAELGGKGDEGTVFVIPLPSRPLQLSQACYVLTSASFPRHLTYQFAKECNEFTGGWSTMYNRFQESDYPTKPDSEYVKWLRGYIGMESQDLYIKPTHVNQTIVTDPVHWLNKTLAEFNQVI